MAGGHHLSDGALGRRLAEQLDEEDEPLLLAGQRAAGRGENLEVAGARFAEASDARRQCSGSARLVLEGRALVARVLDVLAHRPATPMPRNLLVTEEDADRLVVGANEDRLADQACRDRVAIAIETDPEGFGDRSGEQIVGLERHGRERLEQPLLLALEHERGNLAGDLVDAAIAGAVAP